MVEEQIESKPNLMPLYELNLAEFPLFLLSSRAASGSSIRYSDTIMVNDQPLQREWVVTWSNEYGAPGQAAQETFFALFQIWKDQNFASQQINFGSYRNLLMRRNPSSNPGKSDYLQLSRTLDCLFNLTISSKNAFYDIERKKHVDVKFHLFDIAFDYKNSSGEPDSSTTGVIKASDFLYGAVLRKSLFPLNIDEAIFYRLTGMQRRLLVYLKKMLYSQPVHRRNLFDFAAQLPTHAARVTKVRQQIREGVEFLVEQRLVSGLQPVRFYHSRSGEEMVEFRRVEPQQISFEKELSAPSQLPAPEQTAAPDIEKIVMEIERRLGDTHSRGSFYLAATKMDYWSDIRPILSDVESQIRSGSKFSPGALFTYWIKKRAIERGIELYKGMTQEATNQE